MLNMHVKHVCEIHMFNMCVKYACKAFVKSVQLMLPTSLK